MNPNDNDLTEGSSRWLASRIMPGRGAAGISFSSFISLRNRGARNCLNSDLMTSELLGLNSSDESIVSWESVKTNLMWRGLWTVANYPVIGRGHTTYGLTVPFNSFNVGYRYRTGWIPKKEA